MLLLHWAQGHGTCLTHLSMAPFPHIHDRTAHFGPPESVLCEPSAAMRLPPALGKAAADGDAACWRVRSRREDQPRVVLMVVVQARARTSWSNVGPVMGDTSAGMGGRRYGISRCLPQVAAGEMRRCGVLFDALMLWLLAPKPSLTSSSVSHIKGLCVFISFVLHMHY